MSDNDMKGKEKKVYEKPEIVVQDTEFTAEEAYNAAAVPAAAPAIQPGATVGAAVGAAAFTKFCW